MTTKKKVIHWIKFILNKNIFTNIVYFSFTEVFFNCNMTRKFQKLRFGKNIKLIPIVPFFKKSKKMRPAKTEWKLKQKKTELRQRKKVATPSFHQNTLPYVPL